MFAWLAAFSDFSAATQVATPQHLVTFRKVKLSTAK
jgi:hypothetical protein